MMQRGNIMNIVFVCTGNTCRSPMAEGIFRKKTEPYSDFVSVLSCGINAFSGDHAAQNAVYVMAERNIDISNHRSRQINQYIIDEADYIICMSQSHYSALKPYAEEKLMSFGYDIPDPFSDDIAVYRNCADTIEKAIDNILATDIFIDIKPMNKGDIEIVSQIEKNNFSEPWSYDSFVTQTEKDYAVNFTSHFAGMPIGYICCDNILGEVNINTVAVDDNFRNHSIGTKLINKVVEWCKKNNAELLTLEVRESNTPAICLYKKCGFEIIGKRKNFYSKPVEDALIMTKYFNGDSI